MDTSRKTKTGLLRIKSGGKREAGRPRREGRANHPTGLNKVLSKGGVELVYLLIGKGASCGVLTSLIRGGVLRESETPGNRILSLGNE